MLICRRTRTQFTALTNLEAKTLFYKSLFKESATDNVTALTKNQKGSGERENLGKERSQAIPIQEKNLLS